jgi:pimeloyl-ACP methyl ester carboxylesterase
MKESSSMKKWIRNIAFGLVVLLVVVTGAFIWWGNNPLEAMPEAIMALESDHTILVSSEGWIVFSPRESSPVMGLILYPGGHVDPRAYAPLAREIASDGNLVVIPQMPLNLAVFDIRVADEIIQANPILETWVIGGHSLGGAMAAEYVSANRSSVDGLFMWASYSAENTDLSGFTDLQVLSIYGTEDGDVEGIRASRERLPQNTLWVEIDGANHAQFGWYGEQPGDGVATISRKAQQEIILENTLAFLRGIRP